jgi:hypothetical protein
MKDERRIGLIAHFSSFILHPSSFILSQQSYSGKRVTTSYTPPTEKTGI